MLDTQIIKVLEDKIPPLPQQDAPDFWYKIRSQFPMPRDESYCNTGTIGASPLLVLHAVVNHMTKSMVEVAHVEWKGGGMSLLSGYSSYKDFRAKIGKLINADFSLIALTQNATMGMNILSNGLDLKKDESVLITDIEHSGGRCGWELLSKRHGNRLDKAHISFPVHSPEEIIDTFAEAIKPDTRVMSFPHISSEQGMILPVKELCKLAREHNIISIIDGAQATGQIKVDIKQIGCDAYYASPHKWLMAPAGNGILYINENLIDDVWTTLASSQWNNHKDNGYRLGQRGTGNPALIVGLEAAIDFHFMVGPEKVYERIKTLGDHLRKGLDSIEGVEIITPIHPDMNAGLTTFKVQNVEGRAVQDTLWKEGRLQPRALSGERGVRYSTHIYNSFEENEKALKIISNLK